MHGFAGWYAAYLDAFAALGRGDRDDVEVLLGFYAVPLLLCAPAGAVTLTTRDEVLAAAVRQIEALRAEGYDRSEPLGAETTEPNPVCVLHRARFARRRADGSEIARVEATYVVTGEGAAWRIGALILGG